MTTTTVRLTVLEQTVARLVASRGERISDLLRTARQRLQAGEAAPTVLHSVGEFEAMARLPGIAGRMGRARLRLARGIASVAGAEAAYSRQGVDLDGAGHPSAPGEWVAPVPPIPTLAGPSERDLLLQRIDATLARVSGHV